MAIYVYVRMCIWSLLPYSLYIEIVVHLFYKGLKSSCHKRFPMEQVEDTTIE